jgi:hypothetical protein
MNKITLLVLLGLLSGPVMAEEDCSLYRGVDNGILRNFARIIQEQQEKLQTAAYDMAAQDVVQKEVEKCVRAALTTNALVLPCFDKNPRRTK